MKTEIYRSSIISNLLKETSPEESEKIEKRMILAAKIDKAIKAKGWDRQDLLKALNKEHPSIISKWLSGTHNFTTDTLFDLERVLGVNLINLEEKPNKISNIYHFEGTQRVFVKLNCDTFENINYVNSSRCLGNGGDLKQAYQSFFVSSKENQKVRA